MSMLLFKHLDLYTWDHIVYLRILQFNFSVMHQMLHQH